MSQFINSGQVIDVALGLVVLEFALLLSLRRWWRKTAAYSDLLAHLGAAAGLLGATDLLMRRSAWEYPAAALSAALIAHLFALRLRCRPEPGSAAV